MAIERDRTREYVPSDENFYLSHERRNACRANGKIDDWSPIFPPVSPPVASIEMEARVNMKDYFSSRLKEKEKKKGTEQQWASQYRWSGPWPASERGVGPEER